MKRFSNFGELEKAEVKKMSSEEVQKKMLKPKCWFQTPSCLTLVMKPDEVIVFSFLLNMHKSHKAEYEDGNWFYCTAKHLYENLNILPGMQRRILRQLRKDKFIEVVWSGVPKIRHIRINFQMVALAIWKAERCLLRMVERNRKNGYDDGFDPAMFEH